MNLLRNVLFGLIILFSFTTCSSDDSNNNPTEDEISNVLDTSVVVELNNIAYATESPRQIFDIYLPANRTSATKTIILVHGGSWVSGDKSNMDIYKNAIIEQLPQYAIVSMNYRYAGFQNPPYPLQTDDITSLVNFLNENAVNYTISDKIGFIGSSAGGHLSLLWSYALDSNNQVEMVCSVVGPTDLTDEAYLNSPDAQVQGLLQLFDFQNLGTEFLQEASPLFQVKETSPPTILFYGGQDPLVPNSQWESLRERLQTLNVEHQFTLYPEEGHGWVGANQLDTATKLLAFIQANL